jgi:hypothetical protein
MQACFEQQSAEKVRIPVLVLIFVANPEKLLPEGVVYTVQCLKVVHV